MTTSYNMIDRFLRQNLSDKDYPSHKEALDAMCSQLLQRTQAPQRTWVRLATEDRLTAKYMQDAPDGIEAVIDYIETKLKEKNNA